MLINSLLRQIGYRSYHGSYRRHACSETHNLSHTHLALQFGWHYNLTTRHYACTMTHLCHTTIHIYNVSITLDSIGSVASCLIDIVRGALALLVGYGIGIHNGTIHLDRSVVLRHNKTVALAQHYISIATWILQCFLKVDAYGIFVGHIELGKFGILGSLSSLLQTASIVAACRKL